MRFLDLSLLAFGPFSNVTLDLSAGESGLHLVYGPNEAGKSSALRAIHSVLFGIPHQSTDNFIHDYKDLRVGCTLQTAAGERLTFVRRKGRSETLLNPQHPQGAAFPDQVLAPFLHGVDGEAFQRLYGIDHEELERGGNEMRRLRGLVGESLFATSFGGSALAEILASLDEDAATLFGKKRNSAIRLAKADYQAALKQKRELELSTRHWEDLQQLLAEARSHRDQVVEHLKARRIEVARTTRIRNSLRWIAERSQLHRELEQIGDVVTLPPAYSADERSRCESELKHLRARIEALQRKLAGEGGLRAQIAQTQIRPGLLECEDVIGALQERLGAHLKADHDRTIDLVPQRNELQAQVQRLARDLRLDVPSEDDVSWEDLESMRIPPDRRVAIQNLANEEPRLRAKPQDLARQRAELELGLSNDRTELSELGEAEDTSMLRHHVAQATRWGDLDAELDHGRRELEALEATANRRLATLGLWQGDLGQLVSMAVPLRETVDQFERQFASLAEEQQLFQTQATTVATEASEVRQEIRSLKQGSSLPTEEELSRLRQQRSQQWREIRRQWINETAAQRSSTRKTAAAGRPEKHNVEKAPKTDEQRALADSFEFSLQQADAMADRLRREADRVAHLAERQARSAHLEERSGEIAGQIRACQHRFEKLEFGWRGEWSCLGMTDPLSPREMRGWLERHSELCRLANDIDVNRSQLELALDRHRRCCEAIRSALGAQEPAASHDESLSQWLAQASHVLQRLETNERRRTELERSVTRQRLKLDELTAEDQRVSDLLVAWQRKWQASMRWIGCPADASAPQANERLQRLEDLFRQLDQLGNLDARIGAIESDDRQFEDAARKLARRLSPDLVDLPAPDIATELLARLNQARADSVRRNQLVAVAEKYQSELDELLPSRQRVEQQLRQLCQVAGVSSIDELPQIERTSYEVTDRYERIRDIDQQLLDLGEGLSVDEMLSLAEGEDAAELSAQIARSADEIEALESRRDELVAEVRELENSAQAMDGNAAAAEADEFALSTLARMRTDAEQYLRLRFASAVLRYQIEKHRAENQDPLLLRASELFGRTTCLEYSGLRTEFNDQDQPIIVGVRRRNRQRVPVEAMSAGTRDQLYLALRLGYLEHRLDCHEPMPFFVDDILVHFDDDRALATMEVLAELSHKTQVIFFTHHQHLVELAEANLSGKELFLHHLDGPGVRAEQPPEAAVARRPR